MRVSLLTLLMISTIGLSGCGADDKRALDDESHVEHAEIPSSSEIPVADLQPLVLDQFIGEQITLQGRYAQHLKDISLQLEFPDNHKLLPKARPNIVLYDEQGQPIFSQLLTKSNSRIVVDKIFNASQIYAKVGVYYCKQGAEGLCLMQNVLYKIFLAENAQSNQISIKYALPGSHF